MLASVRDYKTRPLVRRDDRKLGRNRDRGQSLHLCGCREISDFGESVQDLFAAPKTPALMARLGFCLGLDLEFFHGRRNIVSDRIPIAEK